MTIYVTPDHDQQFIQHDRIVELTDADIDALMQSNFNSPYEDDVTTELHADCYGDDYANAILADL